MPYVMHFERVLEYPLITSGQTVLTYRPLGMSNDLKAPAFAVPLGSLPYLLP